MSRTFEEVKDLDDLPDECIDDEDLLLYWYIYKNETNTLTNALVKKYCEKKNDIAEKLREQDNRYMDKLRSRISQRTIVREKENQRKNYIYTLLNFVESLQNDNIEQATAYIESCEAETHITKYLSIGKHLCIVLHNNNVKKYNTFEDASADNHYIFYLLALGKYVAFKTEKEYKQFINQLENDDTEIFEVYMPDEAHNIKLFATIVDTKYCDQLKTALREFDRDHKSKIPGIFSGLLYNEGMSRYELIFRGWHVNSKSEYYIFMEYFINYINKAYANLSKNIKLRACGDDLQMNETWDKICNNIPFGKKINMIYNIFGEEGALSKSLFMSSHPFENINLTLINNGNIVIANDQSKILNPQINTSSSNTVNNVNTKLDAFEEFIKHLVELQEKPLWYTSIIPKGILYNEFNKFIQAHCTPYSNYENAKQINYRNNACKKFRAFMNGRLICDECKENNIASFIMMPFDNLK